MIELKLVLQMTTQRKEHQSYSYNRDAAWSAQL
jgi:hypothetical protein